MSKNTSGHRPKKATRQARLGVSPVELKGYTAYFTVKKKTPPTAKIVDAANGVIQINVEKADKGIYEFALQGTDGQTVFTQKIEVV